MTLRRLLPLAVLLVALPLVQTATASDTPDPTSVTIAGSLQSELGCSGDWQPDCAATHLVYDNGDDVWQRAWDVPAGNWEYKAALSDGWDENYGAGGARNGGNIGLALGAAQSVKFYYDHKSHFVTDSVTSTIATAPGSYQSEIGCPGDWQPDCLRSWLQDPDGHGVATFTTNEIPAGDYEVKAAIDESWAENYGEGGVQNGPNIAFTVPTNAVTTFSYDVASHVLTVSSASTDPGPDDNVEWDGLRHDSRNLLYRTPGGAVPAGTPVLLRLRTYANDVTSVRTRLFDVEANAQRILPMELVAEDVSCYQDGLESKRCDFWQLRLPNAGANNVWYRFIVSDGSDTDYYADNTRALDGGLGATTDDPVDDSYALTVYEPSFTTPTWARDAVVYQIFPDRFKNGDESNDVRPGTVRYGDLEAIEKGWNDLPEGYCRNYAGPPCGEGPMGRDYFGGDLKGVRQKLDYLQELGVTTIYFNPVFEANSNHRYDTANYERIDPALGDLAEFDRLVKQAKERSIRVVLDGVFNHMSSDSSRFDRYHRFPQVGACESLGSPFRSWFVFNNNDVPCGQGDYVGWFGFDTIPVLQKTNPAVQEYFVTGGNSISKLWLRRGAAGWRLDVSGDPSFPNGYWEAFRTAAKGVDAEAWTISETWGKDTTLLRILRGDRLDSTMNYRLRDAVIGLLTPGTFDSKGFPDSGRVIAPSEFASRLASVREDYADPAFYTAMNLLDSHDTERLLWTLTPGAETRADKELNAANVAEGKRRLRLASLIQFAMPGAPTVYYGDEVGVTGDDDPDDRRTMPWPESRGTRDLALLDHYKSLTGLRRENSVLRTGSFRVLLANDDAGVVAIGRKTSDQAAILVLNRSGASQTVAVPRAGFAPASLPFSAAYAIGGATLIGENVALPPMSGVLLVGRGDLDPPAAPTQGEPSEGDGQVTLNWGAVAGAAGYNVYRSPVSGGGYVQANGSPLAGTSFTDTGLPNGKTLYYIVRSLDEHGNESGPSNERTALPHLSIGWANTQWPPSMTHTISAVDRTDSVYGQVWIDGQTNRPGATPSLRAQLGFGPDGSNPAGNDAWEWVEAAFNVDVGNNDEFVASLQPESVGTFDYAYRYSTTGGREWVYADLNGIQDGYNAANAGSLTVSPSGDTAAPPTPAGLRVVSGSPGGIELAWDPVSGDPSLYGYEVRRSESSSGPFATIARITETTYTDTTVTEGATYWYVVRSLDTSFNRSPDSSPVSGAAAVRTVTVVFTVTVPDSTPADRSVYIAGTLSRLDGGHPDWNPGGVVLNRVDETHWQITLTGRESTQIEYKYTLGDWEHVEKDASCGEIANRQLTLSYGTNGTQTVNDMVPNWRNVSPCGN